MHACVRAAVRPACLPASSTSETHTHTGMGIGPWTPRPSIPPCFLQSGSALEAYSIRRQQAATRALQQLYLAGIKQFCQQSRLAIRFKDDLWANHVMLCLPRYFKHPIARALIACLETWMQKCTWLRALLRAAHTNCVACEILAMLVCWRPDMLQSTDPARTQGSRDTLRVQVSCGHSDPGLASDDRVHNCVTAQCRCSESTKGTGWNPNLLRPVPTGVTPS